MTREIPLAQAMRGSTGLQETLPRPWNYVICSPIDRGALILAVWSIPISIAVAEFFLAVAVIARIPQIARGRERILLPRCFWFWLLWAGLEIVAWGVSPQPALGWPEIRHLLLVGAMFLVMPALRQAADCQ